MIKSNLNQTGVITTAGLDPTNRISGSLSPTGIILSTIQIVVFDPVIVLVGVAFYLSSGVNLTLSSGTALSTSSEA